MLNSNQLNGLTNMINTMNAQQICNGDCQTKRKIEDLKKNYIKAKQNVQNAQPNLNRAEKDYYVSAKGSGYYSKMQEAKYKKEATDAVTDWNNDLSKTWKDIENKLDYYKGLFSYKSNIHDFHDIYHEKYETMVNDIENTRDKKNVNFRLAYFYNYNTSIVTSLLYYLKIIYWVFYVIMIICLILKRQYKDVTTWPFIILAGLFPIIFEYGISWKNPFKNEISKIPSLYEVVFDNFTHTKVDNIYFIFFSLIVLTILLFSFFSKLPFN